MIKTFLAFILTLNNFIFNSKFYLQIKGCAMGAICAPTYTNMLMSEFEERYIYLFIWHFRPKLVNWNESVCCTPIIKNAIQQGVGQLSTTNHSWVMMVFVKSIAPFFGKNKYTNIRRFSTIFRYKTRIFSLQKVQKIQFWVKWLHNIYLTKAKSRTLSLFIENTQI